MQTQITLHIHWKFFMGTLANPNNTVDRQTQVGGHTNQSQYSIKTLVVFWWETVQNQKECTIKALLVIYRNLLKPKKSYIETGIFYENFPLHANVFFLSVQIKLSHIQFHMLAVWILTDWWMKYQSRITITYG